LVHPGHAARDPIALRNGHHRAGEGKVSKQSSSIPETLKLFMQTNEASIKAIAAQNELILLDFY